MNTFETVYSFDENGIFAGETTAQRDKNGELMMPANATDIQALPFKEGFHVVFKAEAWTYEALPVAEEEEKEPQYEPTYADLRREAYPLIGDQLDALWKGGVEAEAMKAEIMAIKQKFPKP